MRHAEFISASCQLDTIFPAGKTLKQVQGDVKRKGFTLAEVLITLVVIGIVSAITVPILRQSTEGKEYDAARQKALMTIGQAGRQMATAGLLNQAAGTSAETFVKDHFSKYVKIAKMCGSGINNLEACGIPKTVKNLSTNQDVTMPTTIGALGNNSNSLSGAATMNNYAFTLANGFGVNLFYNPTCSVDSKIDCDFSTRYVCINAVYDMNGLKKPNKVGKDIGFVTVIYPDATSVAVAPKVYKEDVAPTNGGVTWSGAIQGCGDIDRDLILPNKDEVLAMSYNKNLLGLSDPYWSSSEYSSDFAWIQGTYLGDRCTLNKEWPNAQARCIYR